MTRTQKFRTYREKIKLLDWFDDFLKRRIKNLDIWDDEIEEIYNQALKDNQTIRKKIKQQLSEGVR